MKKGFLIAAVASFATLVPALTAPAIAQTRQDQRRWDDAQTRYRTEFDRYLRERDIYTESRLRYRSGSYQGGNNYQGGDNYDRYRTDYDAAHYYREGSQYSERPLTAQDEVYRGSDGRYYCKRNDGTTGLIIGGAGGAVLGNVIDSGHNRVAGTLIGGALGALLGRAVDQSTTEYRCR